jgi:hypothetical protein
MRGQAELAAATSSRISNRESADLRALEELLV